MIYEALKFADRKHKGQVRKASGRPYVTHPIAVSYLLARYKVSKYLEVLIVACLLHDVVEDTGTSLAEIAKRFGVMVAGLVGELTNDPAELKRLGKLEYQKRKLVGISSWALVCKLVDRLHNMSDSPRAQMVAETRLLLAHLKEHRKLSKTHERIVADIEKECDAFEARAAAA